MPTMNPVPNLNGTSREALINARLDARDALLAAMEKLGEMFPHGRDYLGNHEARQRDLHIHNERIRALDAVICDLMDEAVALSSND